MQFLRSNFDTCSYLDSIIGHITTIFDVTEHLIALRRIRRIICNWCIVRLILLSGKKSVNWTKSITIYNCARKLRYVRRVYLCELTMQLVVPDALRDQREGLYIGVYPILSIYHEKKYRTCNSDCTNRFEKLDKIF